MTRLVIVLVLLSGCAMLEVPLSGSSRPTAVPAHSLSWQNFGLGLEPQTKIKEHRLLSGGLKWQQRRKRNGSTALNSR
jgi:hypothetical protein